MRTEFVALALSLIAGSIVSGCPSPAFPACQRGDTLETKDRSYENTTSSAGAKVPENYSPSEIRRPPENKKSPEDRDARLGSLSHGSPNSPENDCEKLLSVRRSIYYLNTRSYKMALQLRGIYTREGTLYFCLRLCNHSHIDYGVDSIRFIMADDQQLRKTPAGGTTIAPLSSCGNTRLIRGKTAELCIFALPRFTLPGRKRLLIEVSEKNGGRRLRLLTDNYTLVKARLI
jgi:hypothetical protein